MNLPTFKILAVSAFCLAASLTASAQIDMPGLRRLNSPQINPDGTVTFRLYAPQAKEVQIRGDFQKKDVKRGDRTFPEPFNQPMKKSDDGTWEFQSGAVPPEMYSYIFIVDGVNVPDPSNAFSIHENNIVSSRFIVSKEKGDAGWLYSIHDVPHGSVSKVWYNSPAQGIDRRATVYTPPGYDPADTSKRYPVMYLCHGGGQNEEKWQAEGRTCQILDNLIASGKAKPMIVVMPNGNAGQFAAPNEGPVDGKPPQQPRMRQTKDANPLIFPDLIAFIDSAYRTIPDKNGRAMCGLSMGGYQTFYYTMEHPETFGWIGLFSPGALPDWGDPTPAVEQYRKSEEIMNGLKKVFDAKPSLYWVGIGIYDGHREDIRGLKQLLEEEKYPFFYMESDGAHEWKAWRIHLADFAQKIFQ
jgi:enterochelin esterase family protein